GGSLQPKHFRGNDLRRKETHSAVDDCQVVQLVWVGQMANVPGQQKIHFMHAGGGQMHGIPLKVGRNEQFIDILACDCKDLLVDDEFLEWAEEIYRIRLAWPVSLLQL